MKSLVIRVFAIGLVIVGFVVFWLPIPIGALMIAAGLVLLIGHSRTFAIWLRRRRHRNPKLHRFMSTLEEKLPPWMRDVIERTDPDKPLPPKPKRRLLPRLRR